jgi:predicted Zn-dependent peptidase
MEDVRRFFRRHFVGDNLVLCVTGPVSPDVVASLAQRDFAALPRGQAVSPEPARTAQTKPAYQHVVSDSSQTEMRIAWRAIAETDPRNAAQQLLLRLLDDGMATPLHREIVDVRGLVYEVSAALDPYQDTGVLDVAAAAQHDKVPEVLELILSMCADLTAGPAVPRELDKAKRRYRWELEAMADDPLSLSGWFGAGELFEDAKDLEVWADEVDRVTAEDVQALAETIFAPENLNVLTVGLLGRRDRKQIMTLVDKAGRGRT